MLNPAIQKIKTIKTVLRIKAENLPIIKNGVELSLLYQRYWYTRTRISEPTPRS